MERRYIGVVGARELPESYRAQVLAVVRYLAERGYGIFSGGAFGADQFVLEAVLSLGLFQQSRIFSAWDSVAGFPAAVRPSVERFLALGGQVTWGLVPLDSSRGLAVAGLLARSQLLVSASSGIVAFLHGESRGTLRTVREACRQGRRVVVFLCGGASLPELGFGRWVRCTDLIWTGAHIFKPGKAPSASPFHRSLALGAAQLERSCHGKV